MAKKRAQEQSTEELTTIDVGVVHVMPKAYRGGKLPEGQSMRSVKKSEEPKKTPEPKTPPKPAPKKPAPNPKALKKAKKQKRTVLFVVLGVVGLVLILVVVIVLLTLSRSTTPPETLVQPQPTTPVVTEPPTTPVATPPEPPGETPDPFDEPARPGRDTDSDGLSDAEERLFNSNARLPDSDDDGFLDGNEVFHQYDPSRLAPVTLEDSGFAERVTSVAFTLLAPTAWQVTPDPNSGVVNIAIPTGERMVLTPMEKPDDYIRFDLWVIEEQENLELSVSKTGYPIATDAQQMTAYLDIGRVLVKAEYTVEDRPLIDYLQTFQMIVHSLEPVI